MATTYYVDYNLGSVGGAGTIGDPFKNWTQFESVYAVGDTLLVRGGVFNLAASIEVTLQGSAGNDVTVAAYPGEYPDYRFTTSGSTDSILRIKNNSHHLIVDGIETSYNLYGRGISVSSSGSAVNNYSHDITFRNCRAEYIQERGMGGAGHDITWEYCRCFQCGRDNEGGGKCQPGNCGGWPGIMASFTLGDQTCSHDWTWRGCVVENSWGEGYIALRLIGGLFEDCLCRNAYSKNWYLDKCLEVTVNRCITAFDDNTFQREGRNTDGFSWAAEGNGTPVPNLDPNVGYIDIVNCLATGVRNVLDYFHDQGNTSVNNTYRNVHVYHLTSHGTTNNAVDLDTVDGSHTAPSNCSVQNSILDGGLRYNNAAFTFNNNDWWNNGVPGTGTHNNSFSLDPQFPSANVSGEPSGFMVPYDSPVRSRGLVISGVATDFFRAPRPTSGSTTVGFHEALLKRVTSSGSLVSSGSLTKRLSRSLTGALSSITSSFSGIKVYVAAKTGVLTTAGTLNKHVSRSLSASLGMSGSLSSVLSSGSNVHLASMSGSLGLSGSLSTVYTSGSTPVGTNRVAVFVNGIEYDVISCSRHASLQNPPQTAEIVLAPNTVDHFVPWMPVVIYEQGVKVLTGFVDAHVRSTPPPQISLSISDTFKRARDWFIETNILSNDETVLYWLDYLCDLCALPYSVHSSVTTGSLIIQKDTPMGLRHVADALAFVSSYAQLQMRVTENGVLEFLHISRPSSSDYQLSSNLGSEIEVSDENARNVVKVWGYNPTSGSDIIASVRRGVEGLPADRIGVFANPSLTTLQQATELANAALEQYASLEKLGRVTVIGIPGIKVGSSGSVVVGGDVVFDTITDLRSTVSDKGHTMDLTLGRRSYRYPYFPVSPPPLEPPGIGTQDWEVNSVIGFLHDIALYGNYVYACGEDSTSSHLIRIEKRNKSDGSLVWGISKPFRHSLDFSRAYAIEVNGNGVFICGHLSDDPLPSFSPSSWAVLKYNDADGTLAWEQEVVSGDISISYAAYDLKLDSDSIYIIGIQHTTLSSPDPDWSVIEKRSQSTGGLSYTTDIPGHFTAVVMAADGVSVYPIKVGNFTDLNASEVERRVLTSGGSTWTKTDDGPTTLGGIAIDGSYLYDVIGDHASDVYVFHKRSKSNGTLIWEVAPLSTPLGAGGGVPLRLGMGEFFVHRNLLTSGIYQVRKSDGVVSSPYLLGSGIGISAIEFDGDAGYFGGVSGSTWHIQKRTLPYT